MLDVATVPLLAALETTVVVAALVVAALVTAAELELTEADVDTAVDEA
jgi:hypothetical protein